MSGLVGKLELRLADTPEMIALLRREMALILRHAAAHEPADVQEFATRVATAFEIGATVEDDDGKESRRHL